MSTETAAAPLAAASLVVPSDKKAIKKMTREFLLDEQHVDREAEIQRVMSAFVLNPFEVLNMKTSSSQVDIKKEYRRVSLLCHPDKCKDEMKDMAQKAFTKLAEAKAALTEDDKRVDIDEVLMKARNRVTGRKQQEAARKRKEEQRAKHALEALKNNLLTAGDVEEEAPAPETAPPQPAPTPTPTDATGTLTVTTTPATTAIPKQQEKHDVTNDPDYDDLVKAEIREVIIEREWKKRQLMKAAQAEEARLGAEREEMEKIKADKKQRDADWEDGRGSRVSSWRDFSKPKGKKGKKRKKLEMKMPKQHSEDDTNRFVRRPATAKKVG